jgi:fermentation-respiration switch protein FrsA (DUF1100 family)
MKFFILLLFLYLGMNHFLFTEIGSKLKSSLILKKSNLLSKLPTDYVDKTQSHPGFGLSEGTATENNMYASTSSAISWLKEKGLTNDRFVMFGFSLGSAPVCEVAGHASEYVLQPAKIILEAPFASAEIMIQDAALLSMPGSFLVDLKIDNATEIKKVNVPLLWIHGMADSFLSMTSHGKLVYDNKPGVKESVLVPGGEHETTPFVMGYQAYIDRLAAFIQS